MRQVKKPVMTKLILPIAATLALGVATPVFAADYIPAPRAAVVVPQAPVAVAVPAGPLTLQDALAVATNIGMATVDDTHYDGDEWNIEGHDAYGKWLKVDVDSRTGEVLNVDRSAI